MKIKRHSDEKESNNITALWLYEFAYDLEKNAQNLDYLKEYLNKNYKNKKFNSIEEKLADIRERIGFDLARKVTNEIEKMSQEKTASDESKGCKCRKSCGCGGECCSCSCKKTSSETSSSTVKTAKKHPKKDVELMGNILKYIEDMAKHEPHLDSATILFRCKNDEGLRYSDIENRIDRDKLVSYIDDLLGKQDGGDEEDASYIPKDDSFDDSAEDSIAEYYNHAEPSLS